MTDKKIIDRLVLLKPKTSRENKQIKIWDKDSEVSKYREVNWYKNKKQKNIDFGIYDKKTSKLIGSVDISSIDLENKHAEIGMAIGNKEYWGKGYGTDTVKTILDYCFDKLGLNKVYLDAWEENKRAIGCYLKCGFKKDGVLRESVFRDGKYHNKRIMSILRGEWQELKKV